MELASRCSEDLIKHNSNARPITRFNSPIPVNGSASQKYQGELILKAFDGDTTDDIAPDENVSRLLDAMIPARILHYTDKNGDTETTVRRVCTKVASRQDAIRVSNEFHELCSIRQARVKGICSVKEELVSDCFDEVLRQVTLDCPERGHLLFRVRDELRMTLSVYHNIYKNSIEFGAENVAQYKSEELMKLERECLTLEKELDHIKLEKLELEKRSSLRTQEIRSEMKSRENAHRMEKESLDEQIKNFQDFLGSSSLRSSFS